MVIFNCLHLLANWVTNALGRSDAVKRKRDWSFQNPSLSKSQTMGLPHHLLRGLTVFGNYNPRSLMTILRNLSLFSFLCGL